MGQWMATGLSKGGGGSRRKFYIFIFIFIFNSPILVEVFTHKTLFTVQRQYIQFEKKQIHKKLN